MPGTVIASRIRPLLNAQKWLTAVLDQITNAAPVIPSGADLQVEPFITADGTAPFDFTNVASVTLELTTRNSPFNNNILFTSTIAVAQIAINATLANFNAGTAAATGQQMTFIIPNAATQLGIGVTATQYTLCIYATSTDATPKQQPLLVMTIGTADAGLPQGAALLPLTFKAGSYLAFVCSDGKTRNLSFNQMPGGRWTLDVQQAGYNGPGQAIYSLFCSDGNFRDVQIINVQGVWTLDVGQNGHS
jgi:hypothetical protein